MDEQYSKYYDMIKQQQDANNAWSAAQAQKAMDYQTEMSNTAHQREVADLKAAGLNPVLSAGGSGATTGSGVAASAGNENISALYGLISKQIDASIKQAEAMATSAKAASGNGYYNPISADAIKDEFQNEYVQNVYDYITNAPAYNMLKSWLKKKFGINPEDVDAQLERLGITADNFLESENGQYILEGFLNSMDEVSSAKNSADLHNIGMKGKLNPKFVEFMAKLGIDLDNYGSYWIEGDSSSGRGGQIQSDLGNAVKDALNKAREEVNKPKSKGSNNKKYEPVMYKKPQTKEKKSVPARKGKQKAIRKI